MIFIIPFSSPDYGLYYTHKLQLTANKKGMIWFIIVCAKLLAHNALLQTCNVYDEENCLNYMNFKIVDDNDRVILLFAVILQTAVASAEFAGKVFKYYHHESMKKCYEKCHKFRLFSTVKSQSHCCSMLEFVS